MRFITCFILVLCALTAQPSRKDILLNDGWNFRFTHQVQPGSHRRVDLPHTWNATDALSGQQDYYRGMGNYEKTIHIEPGLEGKRVFLRFEGVNTTASVFVNDRFAGEHRGGYGAFVVEITDKLKYGSDNRILVKVSNALQLDVMPLVGDFNFYGGIYRDVHLIVTDPVSVALTDYASPGVYLVQDSVSRDMAAVTAKVLIDNGDSRDREAHVTVSIFDGERPITSGSLTVPAKGGDITTAMIPISIDKPHLWNGREDPFIYTARVTVECDGQPADTVWQPLGLRYFSVDPDKGFMLNGKPLRLKGVCRHQDRAERGNALYPQHHDEDAALIAEMGANAVRLAHYPQAEYFYSLMDRYGIVTWAEIPLIGPGGYLDRGYNALPAFHENGKEQLRELIRQHYNHPSICFWGLFNELKTHGDDPAPYIAELNELAHTEDDTRLTTAASFLGDDAPINGITDLIAWNKYFGWYGGSPSDMGTWLDGCHKAYPQYCIGVSEYGAGASIYHQQDSVKPGISSGWWHPENYQTAYHMGNWEAIAARPFVWASFVWNMFDFGAAHRTEGDRPGINDKGLVTFDRKVKKDAFYYYKANWNDKEPVVYIASRRNIRRTSPLTDVMVFSNFPEIELTVNGKSAGRRKNNGVATFEWKDITLVDGDNIIEARPVGKNTDISDRVVWTLRTDI